MRYIYLYQHWLRLMILIDTHIYIYMKLHFSACRDPVKCWHKAVDEPHAYSVIITVLNMLFYTIFPCMPLAEWLNYVMQSRVEGERQWHAQLRELHNRCWLVMSDRLFSIQTKAWINSRPIRFDLVMRTMRHTLTWHDAAWTDPLSDSGVLRILFGIMQVSVPSRDERACVPFLHADYI